MTLKILIADDHALARTKLRRLIEKVPSAECIGEAADGITVGEKIDRLLPELVFLDIHMPGMSGLEALKRAHHRPLIVFTTAYAEHAVEAFEIEALDFLLKPFGRKRFEVSIERARQALKAAPEEPSADPTPLKRLFVQRRGKILPIIVSEVERFESEGDYINVWVEGASFSKRMALEALEARLDPEQFCRIHRSHIINLDRIASIVPFDGSRLQIELSSGTRLIASRSRSRELRQRLGIPG